MKSNTWSDAEAVFVTSPHAGAGVSDSRHVGVQLHGAQRVLRHTVIYCTIMIQVALQMEQQQKKKTTACVKNVTFFWQVQFRFNYDAAFETSS